jgi:hypothetical protein
VFNLFEINASNLLRGVSTGPMALKASVPQILQHRQGAVGQDTGRYKDCWNQGELPHLTRPGGPSRTDQNDNESNRVSEVAK